VGKSYNANKMVRLHMRATEKNNLFDYNFLTLLVQYFFGSPGLAVKAADEAVKYFESVIGSFTSAVFPFYDSLARLALCTENHGGQKRKLMRQVAVNQRTLKRYAKAAPINHSHRLALVAAEKDRVKGKTKGVGELYNRAIRFALENEFIQDAALASELAGKFYWAHNDSTNAESYLRKAIEYYEKWGATAKVKQIEEGFSTLLGKGMG
jgi:hypothetical protein